MTQQKYWLISLPRTNSWSPRYQMMSGLGLALWMMHLSSTSSCSFTTSSEPDLRPTSSALVGGTARQETLLLSSLSLELKTEILTENIELCTGSNWLISSIGTHLALIHSFISETRVINLKIEHPALVWPQHCVPSEARQFPIISCKIDGEDQTTPGWEGEVVLPSVRPSLVHWTLPARSPITQFIMARPPSATKESWGVVRKNCWPEPAQSTTTAAK